MEGVVLVGPLNILRFAHKGFYLLKLTGQLCLLCGSKRLGLAAAGGWRRIAGVLLYQGVCGRLIGKAVKPGLNIAGNQGVSQAPGGFYYQFIARAGDRVNGKANPCALWR